MKLLEVERKFDWKSANLRILAQNRGRPPFCSRSEFRSETFCDTYFDRDDRLSTEGLWVRKRFFYDRHMKNESLRTGKWEAKRALPGSSFARSSYEETQNLSRIRQLVGQQFPLCAGPHDAFGLQATCRFVTYRRSFLADRKFTVVLDETDFGHTVGEVELLAENAQEAHADIDAFLTRYAWFFDCSKPKGKLTAYFEQHPSRM